MRFVAILCSLLMYVVPLQSNRLGNEVCYQIVKVKITRLDCSVHKSPPLSPQERRKRQLDWGIRLFKGKESTASKKPTPSPEPTTLPPSCKNVTERRFIRIPIHTNPVDPLVHHFSSPNFPHLPNMKIKCQWDITGQSGKKYYVSILDQSLKPSLGAMVNCLTIKGKARMCNGNFIPVLTNSNRLLMRMTIDPAGTEDVKGGLNGFYLEYDPTKANGGIPVGTIRPLPDKNNQTKEVLICNATNQGPDKGEDHGVTRHRHTRFDRWNYRNSIRKSPWTSLRQHNYNHTAHLFKTNPLEKLQKPPTNSPQEETDPPTRKTDAPSRESDTPQKAAPTTIIPTQKSDTTKAAASTTKPASSTTKPELYAPSRESDTPQKAAPTTIIPTQKSDTTKAAASTTKPASSTTKPELYEEDDVCEMEPPQKATALGNLQTSSVHKRYFYNTSSGDCEEIMITMATLAKHNHNTNSFRNETHCQRTCMNVCLLPMDEGIGNDFQTKFSYQNKDCVEFVYKGKGGNANRFNTLKECKMQCSVDSPNFEALKAIKKVINNPANAAEYKLDKKFGCLIQHLTDTN